jgi:hypothetical protein
VNLVRLIGPLAVVVGCAILVFAFSASAAPAHAEKWALWAHSIRSGVEEWRMVEEATTAAKCWASIDDLKILNVDAGAVHSVVDGHKKAGYYRGVGAYVVELTCLPNAARR